ncbi:MAG: sugar phosphate nucleotidyltransferase [Beutenbergiaceae bacterium]
MSGDRSHRYAVILAGGHGKRLWPLSTDRKAKQFRGVGDTKPMLVQTYERLAACVPAGNIFISTTAAQAQDVRAVIPQIDPDHLIVEPRAAGKPAAFLLAAHRIHELDPEAIVLSSASDTLLSPLQAFQRDSDRAFAFVQDNPEWLALFGSTPDRADTSLGYVRANGSAMDADGVLVARGFYEKPDQDAADEYAGSGEYFWNSSHYFFATSALIEAYQRNAPQWAEAVRSYATHDEGADYPETGGPSHEVTPFVDGSVPIGVVPVEFTWHDMGTWPAVHRALAESDSAVMAVSGAAMVDLDSRDTLVVNESPMTIITGQLEGLAIIVTNSVVLVAPLDDLGDESDLLSRLRHEYEIQTPPDDEGN